MKKYIEPSLKVVKISAETLLNGSEQMDLNNGSVGTGLSRGNRGNLTDWDDDED